MQTIVLEFADSEALDDAVRVLWDGQETSGEVSIAPLPDGRWRMEVVAEKPLRGSILEKIGGRIKGE